MAQPDAYNRRKDFADQDGDDTDNSAINTELDAAGRSINQIRENLAKIQRDDGALRSGSVGKDQLAPDAFDGFRGDLDAAVNRAIVAADESTRSAVASENSSRDAAASSSAAAISASNARQSAANAAGAAKAMFDGIYMGSRATDPATDGNGQPLTDGDFYFNNVAKLIRAYDAASGKFVNATPSGQFKREEYKADDDFEPGVTDMLTLPTDPGIAANVFVSFDGVNQHNTNFTLAGSSLVFGEPIPAGVQSVDVAYIEAILFPREAVVDGVLAPAAAFPDVPRLKFGTEDSDDVMNRQASALAARTELLSNSQNASLFKRSKFKELSFRDQHYDYLKPLYNYGDLYPQSFCMDAENREIFILKSAATGDNNLAWIWVHDMDTGAVKTVFTTGEGWRESLVYRKIGSDRFLYTISSTTSSVIRIKINTFPSLYAAATIDQRYTITNPALTFLAWDGIQWWVHTNRPILGGARRNVFYLYNDNFTELLTKAELPREAFGDFDASVVNEFVKCQGITAHKGKIYSAVGGVYVNNFAANKDRPLYRQGLFEITPQGEITDFAVCDPVGHMQGMSQITGYTNTLAEPEGCCSDGDSLFALWVTLDPWIREDDEWLGKGIVICREKSTDGRAIDFSEYASIQRRPFDVQKFQSRNHHDSYASLKNPITGEVLDSFAKVISMMIATGMSEYKFSGTGQVMTDIAGASVTVSGRQITFNNVNGTTFIINITGSGLTSCQYAISNATTTPVQNGPIWTGAEFGSNANGEYIKYANGHLECWFYSSTGMICDVTAGSVFRNNPSPYGWTYPHAFAAGSVPMIHGNPCNGGRWWGGTTGVPSNTSATPIFLAYNNDPTSRPYQLHAIGRWK